MEKPTQQKIKRRDAKLQTIYSRCLITRNVVLPITAIGKNIRETIDENIKASFEGKVAVEALSGEPVAYDVAGVPAVIFTDPEIAWCGLTEIDAQKQGIEVKKLKMPWAGSGRAL